MRHRTEMAKRFTSVSRAKNSIYLCLLSSGYVKVGRSDNPRTRLSSLQCYVKRNLGMSIVDFVVFDGAGNIPGPHERSAGHTTRRIEKRCIQRLNFIGTPVATYTEMFVGVEFSTAINAVESAINSLRA